MTFVSSTPLRFQLPVFEGPLDLLLHLIRSNEVDIYDIPIAEITRQYLEQLAEWERLDLAVAGEYIVMAATLVEIKSRMLLPRPAPPQEDDEPDPREELVRRLVEYERYTAVVEHLRGWEEYRSALFFRNSVESPEDYLLPLEEGLLSAPDLARALQRLLSAAGVQEASATAIVPRRRVSLKMKMAEIVRAASRSPDGVRFTELWETPFTLTEVVMAFLAVLELLRIGRIRVVQRRAMADFRITVAEVPA